MENNKSWIVIIIIAISITGVLAFWLGKKFSNLTEPAQDIEQNKEKEDNNNVIDQYYEARIDNFQNEIRALYKTAQTQFLSDSITLGVNEKIIYTNGCTFVNEVDKVKELEMVGGVDFKYYIEMTVAGQVTKIRATNGSFSYKYDRNVNSNSEYGIRIEEIVVRDIGITNQLNNYKESINVCESY